MNRVIKNKYLIMLIFNFLLTSSFSKNVEFPQIDGLESLLFLDIPTTVASVFPSSVRESPGIVSVIQKEEIIKSGARDLIDVLRLVPGMEFGLDINGIVDIGIRGNWAHEGKILLLWDGMPMNELLYGNLAFGNHYPVNQIQKIEIIRGPGSAIYGGCAELGVISITTMNASDVNGTSTSLSHGQMTDGGRRESLNFSFGKTINDLSAVAHVYSSQGIRSDQDYTSYYGSTYNFKNNSDLKPTMLNLNLTYKELSLRYISDEYHTTERDWYSGIMDKPYSTDFNTYIFDIKYNYKINDDLTITPEFNVKKGSSWKQSGEGRSSIWVENSDIPYDGTFDTYYKRYTGEINTSYVFNDKFNIILGALMYQDELEYFNRIEGRNYACSGYTLNYKNMALYSQGIINSFIGNLTIGGRFENHEQYGSSFVPRFAFTNKFEKFHFKALYAHAFKAPNLDIISFNPDIKPEKSKNIEFETGYQINQNMILTANIFDLTIQDNMIYYTYGEEATYINVGKTGTQGIEFEYKYLDNQTKINCSYSFYKANKNEVDKFSVPGKDDIFLAFPANKLTLSGQYQLNKFSINSSITYYSESYGYERIDEEVKKIDPYFLSNIFFIYSPTKELQLGFGVYDLLNSKPSFIQAYDAGFDKHSPIPGPSREYIFKITYELN